MTALLFFLLSLFGFDIDPVATTNVAPVQRSGKHLQQLGTLANGRTTSGPQNSQTNFDPGNTNVDAGGRGGGSRQIGGPVIVFDDVMFKPVGN